MIVYKKTFTEFEIKCIIVRLHKKLTNVWKRCIRWLEILLVI